MKKLASDLKLIFYSSTITMMHGPINIRIKMFNIICLDIKCGNVLPDNCTSKFTFVFKPISFISSPFCSVYGHNNFYFIITFGSLNIKSVTNNCRTNNIYVNNIFLLD